MIVKDLPRRTLFMTKQNHTRKTLLKQKQKSDLNLFQDTTNSLFFLQLGKSVFLKSISILRKKNIFLTITWGNLALILFFGVT